MRPALLVLAVLGASGCDGSDTPGCPARCVSDDGGRPRDAGVDASGDAGIDAPDFGPGCPLRPGVRSGAACTSGGRCLSPLVCQTEIAAIAPMTVGLDGGSARGLEVTGFPDSMCATLCDPEGDGSECNGAILAGRVRVGLGEAIPGTCRPRCAPTHDDRGCARDGYACDVLSGTCMEACVSDEQCRFAVAADGSIVYQAGSGATCSAITGRCEVPGDDAAVAGDPCTADVDCEDDGVCFTGDAWPGGYCSRLGCTFPGFECDGADEVCDVRALDGISACLEGCTVNAETRATERLGIGGGNPTCADPGFACAWDGLADPSAATNGGCLPGNYNAETTYDVGTACLTDADCFSPLGYGRCLFADASARVPSGMCAIGNCRGGSDGMPIGILGSDDVLDPALRDQLCDLDAGDLCVNVGGIDATPRTYCITTCAAAGECPPGYACAPLLAGSRICWPTCTADADCRDGASCRDAAGTTCGGGAECRCTEGAPAAPSDAGAGDAG